MFNNYPLFVKISLLTALLAFGLLKLNPSFLDIELLKDLPLKTPEITETLSTVEIMIPNDASTPNGIDSLPTTFDNMTTNAEDVNINNIILEDVTPKSVDDMTFSNADDLTPTNADDVTTSNEDMISSHSEDVTNSLGVTSETNQDAPTTDSIYLIEVNGLQFQLHKPEALDVLFAQSQDVCKMPELQLQLSFEELLDKCTVPVFVQSLVRTKLLQPWKQNEKTPEWVSFNGLLEIQIPIEGQETFFVEFNPTQIQVENLSFSFCSQVRQLLKLDSPVSLINECLLPVIRLAYQEAPLEYADALETLMTSDQRADSENTNQENPSPIDQSTSSATVDTTTTDTLESSTSSTTRFSHDAHQSHPHHIDSSDASLSLHSHTPEPPSPSSDVDSSIEPSASLSSSSLSSSSLSDDHVQSPVPTTESEDDIEPSDLVPSSTPEKEFPEQEDSEEKGKEKEEAHVDYPRFTLELD